MREEMIVQPNLCLMSVIRRNPMQSTFNFTPILSRTTTRIWIVSTTQLHHLSRLVFDHLFALNYISVFEADFTTRPKAKKFLWRVFHKIILFNINNTGKRHLAGSRIWVFWIIHSIHFLNLILRIVHQYNFKRTQNGHHPSCCSV